MDKGQALRMVAYLRVSGQRQARSGLGLEAQKANITAAAEREGWQVVAWLIDAGETGTNTDRPALKQALQLVADHRADGMLAAKLDRVARSVQDFSQLLAWFLAGGKQLVILDPQIDTSTATGRLIANIFASVAEWEADIISDRTSQALQAKRASGLPICRPSVVDNQELVGKIQAMREAGATLQGVADQLNADGIPTLRGANLWRPSAVQVALGYQRPPKRHKGADLPEIRRSRRRSKQAA